MNTKHSPRDSAALAHRLNQLPALPHRWLRPVQYWHSRRNRAALLDKLMTAMAANHTSRCDK